MNNFTTKNIIYADFGNSNAKFLMPNGKFSRLPYDSNFRSELDKLKKDKYLIVYSSVNKTALEYFENYDNIDLLNALDLLDETKLIDYTGIDGVGADRLFGLAGALSHSSPPLITIDSGTAITINALDENKKMLGGIIMPGIQLQEQALKTQTKGLKNINIAHAPELLGKDTNNAVSSGIILGVAEALTGLIGKIKEEYFENKNCNIFLTGGNSLLILPYLQKSFNIIHDELLVIRGIKNIYEKWSTGKN